MTQLFTPRDYQHHIIDHEVDVLRCGVWAGMGMGKSVATLTSLDHMSLVEEPYPALIIAPLRVARSTWPDEALKWSHLHAMRIVPIVGDIQERRAALRTRAEVYTINYENLPWLLEELRGKPWPFKVVVSDESTKLKGFRLRQGSVRAKALAKVAHATPRFIELTGTPSPNGLQDLWGQLWFLDRGERLGRTYKSFTDRWFQTIQVGADRHAVQIKPLPFAQSQIEDALRGLCLSLDAKDYFDIEEPIVNVIRIELPAKARQQYRDMEKEMFAQIEQYGVEAFSAGSRSMKCRQLASGAIYVDPENDSSAYEVVHDMGMQALESIIEEAAGMPVLVSYYFRHTLDRILKEFKGARYLDADPQTIRDWNAGKIPLLVAHPKSAGHGLNLQDGGNIIVYIDHDFNLEERQQILERIGPTRQKQAGYNRPVFVHHIVAVNTVVDTVIIPSLEGKASVQELLLQAMKRNKQCQN